MTDNLATFTVGIDDSTMRMIADRVAEIVTHRLGAAQGTTVARWLTVEQAAEYIGARPQRIYDLRSSGRLRRTSDGGRALVDRHELDQLIERGTA
jgi:excisionase family DNA binding protein